MSIYKFNNYIGRNSKHPTLRIFSLVIFLMAYSSFLFSCKKTLISGNSKFKVHKIYKSGMYFVNALKLSDGSFLTINQSTEDTINFGRFDNKENIIYIKKYAWQNLRFIAGGIALPDGFIISGCLADGSEYFATKYDNNAKLIWDSLYNSPIITNISSVKCCTTPDNSLLLAISEYNPPDDSPSIAPFIVKINQTNGAIINDAVQLKNSIPNFLNCYVTDVFERDDGVFLAGYNFSNNTGRYNLGSLFCLKTDELGNINWFYYDSLPPAMHSTIGCPYDIAYNIAQNKTGPIALTATHSPTYVVASFDYVSYNFYTLFGSVAGYSFDPSSGNILNSTILSTDNKANMPIIANTIDNGFIFAATGNNYLSTGTAPTTIILIKTDANFNVQWQQTFDPGGSNYLVLGIIPLQDGYEVIGQSASLFNNIPSVGTFLIKTNLFGKIID